jgi:hypothetical protein
MNGVEEMGNRPSPARPRWRHLTDPALLTTMLLKFSTYKAEVAAVVSRLKPDRAQQYIDDLAQLNIT